MGRGIRILLLLALVTMPTCAANSPEKPAATAPAVVLETDEQKTLYALGIAISRKLIGLEFSDAEAALIAAGMNDALMGREFRIDMDSVAPRIDPMLNARLVRITTEEKAEGLAYAQAEAAKPGATPLDSGGIYFEERSGDGPTPGPTDAVRLHYHGTLRDGRVFDTSRGEPQPAVFRINEVIPCLSQSLQRMKVGGQARLVCPPNSAYGDRGAPPFVRPGATITFEIHLVGIEENVPPAQAP